MKKTLSKTHLSHLSLEKAYEYFQLLDQDEEDDEGIDVLSIVFRLINLVYRLRLSPTAKIFSNAVYASMKIV